MTAEQSRKVLSIEELITQHDQPLEHPSFDSEHAVSYRTWLAISNFVAYHDPKLLDLLFQGIEFPDMKLDQEIVSFPQSIENVITSETKAKYAHLKQNPRHYGSMDTRLHLFQNIVEAMGDPVANFRVGRNIRVNRDMSALKSTVQVGAKGLLKILGVNPAKIMQKVIPEANRALNSFLDTSLIQYGSNFMDIKIEYYNKTDISPEGDHYTLGTILGGLETIGSYKQITIQALQTPFIPEQERVKHRFAVGEKGVRYTFDDYHYAPDNPVFLYRYTFNEPAQLFRRIGRAIGDFTRNSLPSRITREEARQEESNRHLLAQERELDLRQKREFEVRILAERSRADAAEAKLGLEQQVSGVNRDFGKVRALVHDNKNKALEIMSNSAQHFQDTLRLHPHYYSQYAYIFNPTEDIIIGANALLQEPSLPTQLHSAVHYFLKTNEIITEMITNDRTIMSGGMAINIQPTPYSPLIRSVVEPLQKIYNAVKVEYQPDLDITLNADARLLKVALTNLVSNAIEASQNGYIKINTRQRTRGERQFTILEIIQSGYLSTENAQKLNQGVPFTTKKEGNATGAQASYTIIKDTHRGSINYSGTMLDEQNNKISDAKILIYL